METIRTLGSHDSGSELADANGFLFHKTRLYHQRLIDQVMLVLCISFWNTDSAKGRILAVYSGFTTFLRLLASSTVGEKRRGHWC